jgi:hypothetical protein
MNTARKVGDTVMIDHESYPGLWRIVKINPKNTVVEPVGGGRKLNAPHYFITDPADKVTVTAVPLPPAKTFFSLGELVRVNHGKFEGLYVVIADKGGDRVNIAKIGGDHDRYVRFDRKGLVKVDPSEVLR